MSSAAADEPPAAPAATSQAAPNQAAPVAEGETPAAPAGPAPTEGPAVTPLPPPAAVTPTPAPPSSAAAAAPVDAPLNTPPPARPTGELLPWAGTVLGWRHAVSASLLGVHIDSNIVPGFEGLAPPDSGSYSQAFALSGGYFILRRPPHQLRVATSLIVDVVLTDSGATTYKREPTLRDIPLQLVYTPTLFSTGSGGPIKGQAAMYDPTLLGAGDHRTWGLVSGSLHFPTSKASQGAGRIMTTSLSAGARQQIKLLGSEAPGLTHLVLSFTESWSHFFHEAVIAVNDVQLSRDILVENQLAHSFALVLPLYAGLQLDSSFRLSHLFLHRISDTPCDVQTATGCVDVAAPRVDGRMTTSFSVGLSYLITPELAVDLGYSNTASVIAENGTNRNPFASPNALFYADISFSFDRLYQRFAQPESLRAQLAGPAPAAPVAAVP